MECAVSLDDLLSVYARHPLQGIYVLCVVPPQQTLLCQQTQEIVTRGWLNDNQKDKKKNQSGQVTREQTKNKMRSNKM